MNENYPISISMTPSFYSDDDFILITQLKHLSRQTVKDFDVWLFDIHYRKRKNRIPELAEKLKLDIKHVPYLPQTNVAKRLDCAIFNTGYLFSKSKRNIRLSCYRYVRENFIERTLEIPEEKNVDYYFHTLGPDVSERKELMEQGLTFTEANYKCKRHLDIFDYENFDINWDLIGKEGLWDEEGLVIREGFDNPPNSYQFWACSYDKDNLDSQCKGCFGNIGWNRDNFLAINGTNEVITNFIHFEDLDFTVRADLAGQRVARLSNLMYRVHHAYGSFSQRSNVNPDTPFMPLCPRCVNQVAEEFSNMQPILYHRVASNQFHVEFDDNVLICKTCKLVYPIVKKSYDEIWHYYHNNNVTQAPILEKYKIGRNLRILAEDLDKQTTLQDKIDIFADSWYNERYYKK